MAKRKRDIQLKFRVTPQERDMIETKMAQFGTTNMAAYLRKMAIDGYVVKLDLPELRELVSLLRYSSNNLNQLTKRAHETGRIYEADLESVRRFEPEAFEAIMRRSTNTATVNKNGVKFRELQGIWYNSETLQELAFGKKVYARYKTSDVSKIHIYNEETGEFICAVGFYGEYDYGADEEVKAQTLREYGNHNKSVRNQAKSYKPKKSIDIQAVITSHAGGLADIDISNKPTTMQLDAKKREELQTIKQAESLLDKKEPKHEAQELDEMAILTKLGKRRSG